ncbi:hypothetical protein MEN24_17325 [Dolichospermum sp. ST_sed10]|nr:hypothetical protein [Dolichospermum sp. ST_sed10]
MLGYFLNWKSLRLILSIVVKSTNARGEKARVVFNRVRPELINDHYNWFMVIEPNSADYFIDVDDSIAEKKAREKYPTGWLVTFKINETGACGRI